MNIFLELRLTNGDWSGNESVRTCRALHCCVYPSELRLEIWKHVVGKSIVHIWESSTVDSDLGWLNESWEDGWDEPVPPKYISKVADCQFFVCANCNPAPDDSGMGCSCCGEPLFDEEKRQYNCGCHPDHDSCPDAPDDDHQVQRRQCDKTSCFYHWVSVVRLLRTSHGIHNELAPVLFAHTMFSFCGWRSVSRLLAFMSTAQRSMIRKLALAVPRIPHVSTPRFDLAMVRSLANVDILYLSLRWALSVPCAQPPVRDLWINDAGFRERRLRHVLL